MKKKLRILLVAMMIAALTLALAVYAGAAEYTIATAADLVALMEDSSQWGAGNTYTLSATIDMSGQTQTPIGSNSTPFVGTFNGNNKTIKGINISATTAYAGLFGATKNATIKDLTVSGAVKSTYYPGSGNNDAFVGGLIGRSRNSLTLTNVKSSINVTADGSDVGGLIGHIAFISAGDVVTVTNCVNNGTVSGFKYVGGLIGRVGGVSGANQASTLTVTGCINNGNVTSTGNVVAGILGYYDYANTTDEGVLNIKNCANYGDITGPDYVAGIIGGYLQANHSRVSSVTLTGLYNEGNINATVVTRSGGIAGIIRIPVLGTNNVAPITISDWMHAGTDTSEALLGCFGAPAAATDTTEAQPAAVITATRLYNAVGAKIIRSALGTVNSTKATINGNTVTITDSCNVNSSDAELSSLAANSLWETGVDGVVTLAIAPHDSHTFVSGVCSCGMSVADGKIGTASELVALMNDSSLWGGKYTLTADIDLTGYTQKPIGTGAGANAFTGTFNGAGHTISGINISTSSYTGLFGVVSGATIKNLTIDGTVTGSGNYTGGLVGWDIGPSLVIEDVVSYVDVTATVGAVGGIVGASKVQHDGQSISINDCINHGAIEGVQRVAGIVGYIYSGKVSGTDAYPVNGTISLLRDSNYGTVNATTNSAAGILGTIGYNCPAGGKFTINECANYAAITSAGDCAAGIISTYLGSRNAYDITTSMTELYNSGKITVTTDSAYDGAIIGIFRVPLLGDNGKAPVTMSDWQNTASGTDGMIGTLGGSSDVMGMFSIVRMYNETGTAIISNFASIINNTTTSKITDKNGNVVNLAYNCNSASSDDSLALLAAATSWVTDASGKPELDFIHDHDLGTTGICACGVSIFDEEIATAEEIIFLMNNQAVGSTNLWAKDYKLVANIDLTGYTQTTIGNSTKTFSGSLDGNGFTISGINISGDTANIALFGHAVSAEIKNLTIKGKVTSTATSGGNNVAALIGYGRDFTITNCVSYVDVTCTSSQFVGGFVGYTAFVDGVTNTIDNCINYGDITAKHSAGGIAGGTSGSSVGVTMSITNCKNYGNVTTSNNVAGGIYGFLNYSGTTGTNTFTISKCANYGNVTSNAFTGGILGAYFNYVGQQETPFHATAVFTELLNKGIITTQSSSASGRLGGIIGYLGIQEADASGNAPVTFEDCMHAGATVCAGASTNAGLIGRVGNSTTTGTAVTLVTNNIYNAVGTKYVTSVPSYITENHKYYRNTGNTAGGLLGLCGKTNWVNEGTSEAPAPMLKAFHEHVYVDGVCACSNEFDYAISNVEEMLIFMTQENLWDHDCVIDANIDLTGVLGQQPIGNNDTPYTGVFDGQGYTVTGLNIVQTTEAGAGLFGVVKNATVKNVNIKDAYVSGKDASAALIGIAYAPVTVSGCTVTNATVGSTGARAGGIIGDLLFSANSKAATISSCKVDGTISGNGHVGGIIGRIRTTADRLPFATSPVTGTTVTVDKCTSSATLYGDHYEETDTGGIIGRVAILSNNNVLKVTNCTNSGAINGQTCIGGIIGRLQVDNNDATSTLTGNKITITGNTNSGAISGIYDFAGGIIGVVSNQEDTTLTLSTCKNTGNVTTGAYAGGIIGSYYNRGYFTATGKQTVSKCSNTGVITASATDEYAGEVAGQNAGGIFGLVSTTSVPVTVSELYNTNKVVAGYAYAGGIAGYLRSYANEKASLTLKDAYSKGAISVTGSGTDVGGIAGRVSFEGPISIINTMSTSKVSGSASSDTNYIRASFGRVAVGANNTQHTFTRNYYGTAAKDNGDTKAQLLDVPNLTNTDIAIGVETMVKTSAWYMGLNTPVLTQYTNTCNDEHSSNETYKWAYDSSAKQYYLTCSKCGETYAHQASKPTVYVGNSSEVGIDVNTGMSPEKKVRTLYEAVNRIADVGGTVAICGGIVLDDDVILPDWGDNTITFTAGDSYHDSYGSVTTGFLIKTMDVQLVMGGKAVFDDLLFKAGDEENYRVIISANWNDIDMGYIRSQNGATCYLLAGLYGEEADSATLSTKISTTVNIDGPAITSSSKFRGYFYERVYLGSAFAVDCPDGTTISSKTVTLNVQDGYAGKNATTRTLDAVIYFLYTMSTSEILEDVYTDNCTSIVNLNDNTGVHAFGSGFRNVGEAGTDTVIDASGNKVEMTFTDGNAHLDNLYINFNDNSNIVDGSTNATAGTSDDITFENSGRFYIRNVENTVINVSDEDGIDDYEGEGTRTEPLIHRLFFFKNGTFNDTNTTANVTLNYGRHGFLASFGDDIIFEQGNTGNINKTNYIVTENVDPECDWDEGVITTKPTVSKAGVITYTCVECGRTRTEAVYHEHAYVVKADGTYYCADGCTLSAPTTPAVAAAVPATSKDGTLSVDFTYKSTTAIAGATFKINAPDGFKLTKAEVKLPTVESGTGLTATVTSGLTLPYTVALLNNPAADAKVTKTVVITLTFDVSDIDHDTVHIIEVYDAQSYNIAEDEIETTAVSAEVSVPHEYDYVWEKSGSTYYIPCLTCGEHYVEHTGSLPTVYVDDDNGSDANDGITTDTPVKTLKEAVHRLHKVAGHIKIVGDYNLSASVSFAEDWVNTIYIEGGTINIAKDGVRITQRGNLKYNGVTFVGTTSGSSDIIFEANYHNLTMQNISANTYARAIICAGEYYPNASNTTATTSKIKLYGVTNGENITDSFYYNVVLGSWIKDDTGPFTVENKTIELETVDNGEVATSIRTLNAMSRSTNANVTGVTTENCHTTINLSDNTELYQLRTGSSNVNGYNKDTTDVTDSLASLVLNLNANSHTTGGTIDITNVLDTTVNVSLEKDGRTTPLTTDITFYMNGTVQEEETKATVSYGTHGFVYTLTDPVNQGATATNLTITENVTNECTFTTWDENDDSTHISTCTCGRTSTASHGFTNWASVSDTQHSRTCKTCGYVQTRNHTVTVLIAEAVAPTCGKDGSTAVYKCMHCDYTQTAEVVPATGNHSYGDYAYNGDETHTHTCTVCGATEDGNCEWDEGVVTTNPTPNAKGIVTYTCSICSGTKTEEIEFIEAKQGFSLGVTLLSEYVLEYVVKVDSAVSECWMVFEKSGEEPVTVEPVEVDGKWRFEVPGIAGKEMNDTISGTYYYVKDGVCYKSPTKQYNLVTYYNVMANSDAALKKVLDAMFNYGAAAQTYFNYNADNLVTEHIPADAIIDYTVTDVDADNSSVIGEAVEGQLYTPYNQFAVLEQRILMTLVFDATGDIDTSNLVFKGNYRNINGAKIFIDISGENMYTVTEDGKTRLCVDIDTVSAKDLRQEFTGALYIGDTQVSPTVTTSFESYAATVLAADDETILAMGISNPAALKAVCRATLAYSDAAAEYLKKVD
ncbi:MAG: hypothetical protein IJA60_05925 [Clostridia bacterium]|nr:hypothetical protein [Clostridia bacterium]